jgi:hypothetical protein
MGVDKNSSPKSQTRLCPKFTTKDSHTSLPRLSSHNRPTNPENTSQTNHKRKRNSRSKGLSQSVVPGADCPHGLGGPSAGFRRTIRRYGTNCPKRTPEPRVAHPKNWTLCRLLVDHPPHKDCSHSPRGPSVKHLATENY